MYHPAVRLLRPLLPQALILRLCRNPHRQVLLRHSGVQVHRAMVRWAGEGRWLLLLLLLHRRVELLLLQLMVVMLMLRRCGAAKGLVTGGDLGR